MGCKQSQLRGGGDGGHAQPADLPPVPNMSWYAQPLRELNETPMTPYHEMRRGDIVFAPTYVPTDPNELRHLPGGVPRTYDPTETVNLSHGNLYAMGYLYETALFTEHVWRTRVPHGAQNRFERPFFDTLLTVKVVIDGELVPDVRPHKDSVAGCTATLLAPDAVAWWKMVPLVLVPETGSFPFEDVRVWDGLVASFATYCRQLRPGEHGMTVEVGYGCHNENDFQSGYIARKELRIAVDGQTAQRMDALRTLAMATPMPSPRYTEIRHAVQRCGACQRPMAHRCTTCGTAVCGAQECVFAKRTGYPMACESHPSPESAW